MNRRQLFHTRDRGAVVPIVALLLPVLMVMTAFAVDLGRQRVLRRALQADADVIALDLVRLADGRELQDILDPAMDFTTYVNDTFVKNGLEPVADASTITNQGPNSVIAFGQWDPAVDFVDAGLADRPNAVRVTLNDDVDYFFQPGSGSATRSAVATVDDEAVFSVGSRLLSVDTADSELLDPLLNDLSPLIRDLVRGDQMMATSANPPVLFNAPVQEAELDPSDSISLDALSYEGLAGNNINIGQLLGFVEARSGMTAGSPEEVLDSEVHLLHLVQASADALHANGDGTEVEAVAYLMALTTIIDQDLVVDLYDLLNAEVSRPGAVLASDVNAFDFLLLSAQAANGENLLLTGAELTPEDLQAHLPSAVQSIAAPSLDMRLSVIESPAIGRGSPYRDPHASAETSQIRLTADLGLTFDVDLGLPLLPSLATVSLELPLSVTVGNARATLRDLDCNVSDPSSSVLSLDVTTGAANVSIGEDSAPANVGTVMLLGKSIAAIKGVVGLPLDSPVTHQRDLMVGETASVPGGELGFGGTGHVKLQTELLPGINQLPLGPILSSLLGGITNAVLNDVVIAALDGTLEALDELVLQPVLDVLGVGVASADVRAIDAICDSPKLVG